MRRFWIVGESLEELEEEGGLGTEFWRNILARPCSPAGCLCGGLVVLWLVMLGW